MAPYQNLDGQLKELKIEGEDNQDFTFDEGVEEQLNRYEPCLVGRFLTAKTINTRAMTIKLADVWKRWMGINIKEIEPCIFLFQFYHREDMAWVQNGGPWLFDNTMLTVSKITARKDPLNVPLWHVNIWIQIHDLPKGFMLEAVGKQLTDFFREFVLYDAKNNSTIWLEYMRIKIKLDFRKPLKRKKKVKRKNGT